MERKICFDMDGTIANLYAVENWLNMWGQGAYEPQDILEFLRGLE